MKEKHWGRITVALGRTPSETTISSKNLLLGYHLKWPIHPKTYSSDLRLSLDYVFYSPRTNSLPPLIVVRLFISSILSPTLLQIYCTGLIGLIPFSIWVWATICDPTVYIKCVPLIKNYIHYIYIIVYILWKIMYVECTNFCASIEKLYILDVKRM